MWWLLTILFFLTSVISGTLVFYSLRRINNYEMLILNISELTEYISTRIKTIDNKGSFEADDEIGFFFEEIKNLQKMLDDIFEPDEEIEDAKSKKEN